MNDRELRQVHPVKDDADKLYYELTVDTLARTLWGEARGEGQLGMVAVACVILNRKSIAEQNEGYWWGNDIIQICQKPYQFSCWNRSDPNFRKLISVDKSDDEYATALKIAQEALSGEMLDITDGATHYHALSVSPHWAMNERATLVLEHHIFYRLV